MLRCVVGIFWPLLEPASPSQREKARHSNIDDVREIENAPWEHSIDLALSEAIRLSAAEENRRKTAEGKASTYLLMMAALITLLTYLENAVWDSKFGAAPKYITLPILSFSVLYIAFAGFWSFRVVMVGAFHRIDVTDLITIWRKEKDQIPKNLAIELFKMTRFDRDSVNQKISSLKRAHEFMIRGFISFAILIIVAAGWGTWVDFFSKIQSEIPAPAISSGREAAQR